MWSILFVTGWLITAGIMDVRTRKVPVWMLVLGGALAVWAAFCQHRECLEVLRGMLPGILLLLVALGTKKAGYADGIVLCCLGMAVGSEETLVLLGLGLFLISLCAMALLVLRKVGRDTGLPFLPFLAAAWLVVVRI